MKNNSTAKVIEWFSLITGVLILLACFLNCFDNLGFFSWYLEVFTGFLLAIFGFVLLGGSKWAFALFAFEDMKPGKLNQNPLLKRSLQILLGLCVLVMFFGPWEKLPRWRGDSPSFRDFIGRDQKYYSEVAEGCKNILERDGVKNIWRTIHGDDPSLPSVLRDLHAATILIDLNLPKEAFTYRAYVEIQIGATRDGYAISWGQADDGKGNRHWLLNAGDEDRFRILFPPENTIFEEKNLHWLIWEVIIDLLYLGFYGILMKSVYRLILWKPKGLSWASVRLLLFLTVLLVFCQALSCNVHRNFEPSYKIFRSK